MMRTIILAAILATFWSGPAHADNGLPPILQEVAFDQRLDGRRPHEEGQAVGPSIPKICMPTLNEIRTTFLDYLLPTAVETPRWETDKTCTPSPHHPLGAKGVGESATVGAPAAIANAVVDALWHLGVRHVDIPITPAKVWKLLRERGVTE